MHITAYYRLMSEISVIFILEYIVKGALRNFFSPQAYEQTQLLIQEIILCT